MVITTTLLVISNNNVNGNNANAIPSQQTSTTSDNIPVIYYVIVLVSLMLCCLAMILIFYWYHHRNLVNLIRTTSPRKSSQHCQHPAESIYNIDNSRSTNNINIPIHNHNHMPIPMPSPSSKQLPKPPIKLRPNQININISNQARKHAGGGHVIDDCSTQKSTSPKPTCINSKDIPTIYHAVNNNVLQDNSKYIYNPYMGGVNQYGGLPMIVPGAAPVSIIHNAIPNVPMVNTSIPSINNLKVKSNDSMKITDIAPTEARTALSDITTSSSEESIMDEEDNFDSVSTRMKAQKKLHKKGHNKRFMNKHHRKQYRRDVRRNQSNDTNITLERKQSNDTNITFRIKEHVFAEPDGGNPTTLTNVTSTV